MGHGLTRAAVVVGAALLLAGCGDSHPLPESSVGSGQIDAAPSSAVPAASTPAPAPTTGAFAMLAAPATTSAATTASCNLDAVEGVPLGAKPLARGGSALFAGWAAASSGAAVPSTVTIVLTGAHAYAVAAPTGAPRPDVAKAQGKPELAMSGYQVKADMSEVETGTYKVELRYDASGKAWRCTTAHSLRVQ